MILHLMKKEIDTERSEVLYREPESEESFRRFWEVKSGEWQYRDGWFEGKNPGNFPGMLVSRQDYFGNVMLEYRACTVLPSTHDINAMWNGSWDEEKNERGVAYVAGLQGWWEGKVGFEKSPEYRLNAANPLFPFEAGREYAIRMGSIDGHVFVYVDDVLVLEVTDPDPIDTARYGRVGFEAYCSHIRVRDITVKRIAWRERALGYTPEF